MTLGDEVYLQGFLNLISIQVATGTFIVLLNF